MSVNLEKVTDLAGDQEKLTVRIVTTFSDAGGQISTAMSSGILLDNHHVLTAAHVVDKVGKTVTSIAVYIGADSNSTEFKTATIGKIDESFDAAASQLNEADEAPNDVAVLQFG